MSEFRQPEYKFMTNLFIRPRDRTRYIEALKKLTVDPQVSYQRIFVGLGAFVVFFLTLLFLTLKSGGAFTYVWPALILFAVGGLMLLVLYILPSRGKSMLASVIDLVAFKAGEKVRMKADGGKALINSVGVKAISKTGFIQFDDDEVGALYEVEGQLGLSTLPRVAMGVADVRLQYLIERNATTTEKLITYISRVDLRKQLDYYIEAYDAAEARGDNLSDKWRMSMADLVFGQVKDYYHEKNMAINQFIIIRDIDQKHLIRAMQVFERSAANGMLANYRRLESRSAIERILGQIVMFSRGGKLDD